MKFTQISLASCIEFDPTLIKLLVKSIDDAIADYQHILCFDVDHCLEEINSYVDASVIVLGTIYPEILTIQYLITFDEQSTIFKFHALNENTTELCERINTFNRNDMIVYQ